MGQAVKIKAIENLTHNVLKIVAERPEGLSFVPGQAVDVSINKPGWEEEMRPFTFTSQPEDDHIEFNIKTYTDHDGVTNELRTLQAGDELIIGDVFGYIQYKGEGVFIAGGAGLTPMLSILFSLQKHNKLGHNKLLFANKKKEDIIREEELKQMLGDRLVNVLSDEEVRGYEHGYITEDLIKKYSDNSTEYYYVCGPRPMEEAMVKNLRDLGIDNAHIVREH